MAFAFARSSTALSALELVLFAVELSFPRISKSKSMPALLTGAGDTGAGFGAGAGVGAAAIGSNKISDIGDGAGFGTGVGVGAGAAV